MQTETRDNGRAAFEAHQRDVYGARGPLMTWDDCFAPEPAPEHLRGKYMMKADQQAWEAWQGRTAALSKQQQEDEKLLVAAYEKLRDYWALQNQLHPQRTMDYSLEGVLVDLAKRLGHVGSLWWRKSP